MNIQFNVMYLALALGIGLMIFSFWKTHSDKTNSFNAFDLVMHEGRVDKIAVSYMLVLILSSWIMLDLQINNRMTEGYLGIYVGAWIVPLVSKVVANSGNGGKNESKN